MGLISSIFGPKKAPSAPADDAASTPATPEPASDSPPNLGELVPAKTIDDAAKLPPVTPPGKLGFFGVIKQRLKGEVDDYVNEKAEEARAMAEQFRSDTLAQVKTQAFELLDITEQRIDKKLAEIEKLLDERLQQELKMRLRAMIWTLAFVLLMAIVSMLYVWAKHEAGLDKTPTESTKR